MSSERKHFIESRWVGADELPCPDDDWLVRTAVDHLARHALEWNQTPLDERIAVLLRLVDHLRGDKDLRMQIADQIVTDVGKPSAEAILEVDETVDHVEYYARAARILESKSNFVDQSLFPASSSVTVWEPHGVVACIKPWNFPFENPMWSLVPALLAGNAVVLKPAEESWRSSTLIVDLLLSAGLPPTAIALISGGDKCGELLVENAIVKAVSFTGSSTVGRWIRRRCAELNKFSSIEGSGNDAAIVLADANLEDAVAGIVWGAFSNTGQVCTGVKRVFVPSSLMEQFASNCARRAETLALGRDYGALTKEAEAERVWSYVQDAVDRGARLLAGSLLQHQNTVTPTVLVGCTANMRLFGEEVFGPVLPVFAYDSEDELLALLDADAFGLGASIWSNDAARAVTLAGKLDVGQVWINDVNVPIPGGPWAGRRESGPGLELCEAAFYHYARPKHVFVRSDSGARPWWFPYA